jgi:hypothetical protein
MSAAHLCLEGKCIAGRSAKGGVVEDVSRDLLSLDLFFLVWLGKA